MILRSTYFDSIPGSSLVDSKNSDPWFKFFYKSHWNTGLLTCWRWLFIPFDVQRNIISKAMHTTMVRVQRSYSCLREMRFVLHEFYLPQGSYAFCCPLNPQCNSCFSEFKIETNLIFNMVDAAFFPLFSKSIVCLLCITWLKLSVTVITSTCII